MTQAPQELVPTQKRPYPHEEDDAMSHSPKLKKQQYPKSSDEIIVIKDEWEDPIEKPHTKPIETDDYDSFLYKNGSRSTDTVASTNPERRQQEKEIRSDTPGIQAPVNTLNQRQNTVCGPISYKKSEIDDIRLAFDFAENNIFSFQDPSSERIIYQPPMIEPPSLMTHKRDGTNIEFPANTRLQADLPVSSYSRFLKCSYCKCQFFFRHQLKRHNKIHLQGSHYCCLMCPSIFLSLQMFNRHVFDHRSKHLSLIRNCLNELVTRKHGKVKKQSTFEGTELTRSSNVYEKPGSDSPQFVKNVYSETSSAPGAQYQQNQHHTISNKPMNVYPRTGHAQSNNMTTQTRHFPAPENIRPSPILCKCPFCLKPYSLRGEHGEHSRVRYPCTQCRQVLAKFNKQRKSEKQAHISAQKIFYPCFLCPQKLDSIASLNAHLEAHKKMLDMSNPAFPQGKTTLMKNLRGTISCPLCSNRVISGDMYNEHMKEHFRSNDYRRTHLPTELDNFNRQLMHHQPLLNSGCQQNHTEERILQKDTKFSTDQRSLSQGDRWKGKPLLSGHPRVNTRADIPSYNCTMCQMWFTSYEALNEHLSNHLARELSKCDICGAVLNSSSELKYHLRMHNAESSEKKEPPKHSICGLCLKIYATKTDLKRHMEIHKR